MGDRGAVVAAEHRLRVGAIFSDDRESRELPCGKLMRRTATTVTWQVTDSELDDWMSDAAWQAEILADNPYDQRMCAAAKRAVAAIRRQHPDVHSRWQADDARSRRQTNRRFMCGTSTARSAESAISG